MEVSATVEFKDKSRLFLVEQVFNDPLRTDIVDLFRNNTNEVDDWVDTDIYNHAYKGRLVYRGNSAVVDRISEYAQSEVFVKQLNQILGKEVRFYGMDLWLDKSGYEVKPHYDGVEFDHALQVYMPYKFEYWQMLGTCVYTSMNPHDALFELHYRPNAGYLIDKTHTIIHGVNHKIPSQFDRRSVYLRYKSV